MTVAKLTSKGQVTIPKAVREAMGIDRGSSVQFFVREDGVVELTPKTRDLLSLAGVLAVETAALSVEEMDSAIAAHVLAEDEVSTCEE